MPYKEHGLMLFLDKLMLARFQKYIGDMGLGRSFGGLKLLAIGLHKEGYLTQDEFTAYAEKYSVTLEAVSRPTIKPKTMAELKVQEQTNQLAKDFSGALSQWIKIPEKSKAYYIKKDIKKARENPNVQNAKLILELDSGECIT